MKKMRKKNYKKEKLIEEYKKIEKNLLTEELQSRELQQTREEPQSAETPTYFLEINDKNKNSLSDSSANYNKNINNVNYDRKSKFVREKEGMKREVSGERIKETKASKREVGNMRELNSSRIWEEKASKMGRKTGHDSGKKINGKIKYNFGGENDVLWAEL